ncbi:hypothetical protein ACFWIQ_22275 [Kitasatospora sp. NPDC127059]|uniref:hypothetical protein n=1 Tax=unclassified Kitasatospora TaxID=2633591 RepID=UPI0036677FB5
MAPPLVGPLRRRSVRVLIAAGTGVLAGVLAGGGWYLLDRPDDVDRPAAAATPPFPAGGARTVAPGPASGVGPTDSTDPAPPARPSAPTGPVGPHLTPVPDPAGFTLLVPDGWQRRVDGASVFYDSPDHRSLIQVFVMDGNPPYQQAVETDDDLARNPARFPGYHRIRLERTAGGSAELEYAYELAGSGVRRAVEHVLVGPDGTAWSVLVAGPEDGWPTPLRELLQSEVASFCFAGRCP